MPVNDLWSLNPDGTFSFPTPAGALTSFGPDAAVEMARRDAAQGVQRPLSFYQQAARPPSMATGQQALAYAPEASQSPDEATSSESNYTPAPAGPPPAHSPEAPAPFVAPDSSVDASFAPRQPNASMPPPEAPPPGAAGAQGPTLPDGWGKYDWDKPVKDTWAERK